MGEANGATGKGPLAGLRVLDLSMIVAGGTASSLLADFGAEVVKVERPGGGDPLRNWGAFRQRGFLVVEGAFAEQEIGYAGLGLRRGAGHSEGIWRPARMC